MTRNTETDLHTLLDGLAGGEHVKATWRFDRHVITSEGPVDMDGRSVRCDLHIRWENGGINDRLTSLEVIRGEEVITATRDDEEALSALIDSLESGERITAEWRNSDGSMSITGTVRASGPLLEVRGCGYFVLRHYDGFLHSALHSVTVRRAVVQRWEREGNE